MAEQQASRAPKKWKMSLVVWLAIYPLITFVLAVFGRQLNKIAFLPLRTFLITLILVPIMVYWAMPFVQKLLSDWLKK